MKNVFVAGTVALAMSAMPAFAQTSTQNPQPGQSGAGTSRQGDTAKPSGTSGQSDSSRQQQSRTGQQSQFAMDAAHINMAEVEMGKLAQEKGSSEQVKDFGQRLEDDHSKALDELKEIASDKNITLPTTIDAKHKATHDKLAKLSGAQFDKAFAQEMVTGHKEALQKAQSAAKSEQDPQIKAFANKMVTSVQAHLKVAQNLASGAVGTSGTQDNNDRQPQTTSPGTSRPGSTPGGATDQPGSRPGGSSDPGSRPGGSSDPQDGL
jgi:putative membrane protein